MANRYVLKFTKNGYAKYTSHLDMLRFFKRAFRKSGISLRYSQGFNPHPKMSFAQPLSLGYSSSFELLEFETEMKHEANQIYEMLCEEMPEGMKIEWVKPFDCSVKSLAAAADSAEYEAKLPFSAGQSALDKLVSDYLAQDEIIALKRGKKDKKMVPADIKKMIRRFAAKADGDITVLEMELDCGSVSNCSPELVLSSFLQFAGWDIPRYKIDVERKKIKFVNNLQL